MGNSLLTYLNKRTEEDNSKKMFKTKMAGPVITISREVGCNGLVIANLIAKRLNERKTASGWEVLSKEIFYQSARELNMEPEHVRKIFKKPDKYAFDEILKAFSDKNFKSERKIIKTVADIILSFSVDGFCIIVGRAGHIIAKDIKNALHIRLIAPLNYRINTIMNNNQLNRDDAIAFIKQVEKERVTFRKTIREENLQEELFDLIINRASFTNDEVVDIIELAMDKKGVFRGAEPKIQYY